MKRDHRHCGIPPADHSQIPREFLVDARGFTLIEILIALATFLIVLFAVYTTFESSRSTYAAGEQKADIQQNARIAMELMGADLRLVGYGYPQVPTTFDRTASCINQVAIQSSITNATATSITFWADLTNASTTILNTDVNPGDTTINVLDASGILAGDTIYIINGGQSERVTVQSVPSANQIITTLGTCNGYPWGTQVGRPRLTTYSWNVNTLSKDDGEGGGLEPLADNIQLPAAPDFLFEYFDAADNQIGPPVSAANLPSIRRITINLVAQSPPGWWRPQNFNISSDIRPRNLL